MNRLINLKVLSVFGLCALVEAKAGNFTLTNNVTGESFLCSKNGEVPTDPDCLKKVATFCQNNTTYGRNSCFDFGVRACAYPLPGRVQCVTETFDYCKDNTTLSANSCFDKAIDVCRGARFTLKDFIDNKK